MVRRREGLSLSISSPTRPLLPSLPPLLPDPELHDLKATPFAEQKPKHKKRLSKQLSMGGTPRDAAWEKRRLQMLMIQEKKHKHVSNGVSDQADLTDEDLRELKGSIELGFGFKEEAGQRLCNTLPALDLYFAVTRQLSPVSSPGSCLGSGGGLSSSSSGSSSGGPPCSPRNDSESLKILSPGDNPQQVKTRLRHWAQAVACSVMQSS